MSGSGARSGSITYHKICAVRKSADIASVVLIALAMLRIASTWTLFSATVDEPMHLAAGLQIYTQHDYSYQPENPPLPRLVNAFAPWLGGVEFDPAKSVNEQLLHVFYSKHRYQTNLVLARCGNLLFFVFASLATWWWARRELGPRGGLIATLLFTMQPVIVAHSGLGTTDTAATAGVALSLLAFHRWLERPSNARAIVFGAAYAVAVLCKFSAIGYVPAACVAMYMVRLLRDEETRRAWKRIAPSFALAAVTCAFVIWAGYGFAVDRLGFLEHVSSNSFIARHADWPLPAHRFFVGISALMYLTTLPFFGFAFGKISPHGWWWYFPVALALKSTLASLLLGLGAFFARRERVAAEALAAALAILAVSLTSPFALGVRYVMPIYAPLSVAGAAAAITMLRHHRLKIAAIVLLAWHAVVSIASHPDTLAYFNEAAGPRPWQLLLDSNIDWGQDVLRLKRVADKKKIDRLGISVPGWHDYDALGLPPHYEIQRDVPSSGWIAVGEHNFGIVGYGWLRGRRYERVGKSIRLYYIP